MSEPGSMDRSARLIEQSLRSVGRRPMPNEDAMTRAHDRTHKAWQELLAEQARRRYWRRSGIGLLAASVLAVAVLVAFWPRARTFEPAGIVVRTSGPASYRVPGSSALLVHEKDVIAIGAVIETDANARLALQLVTGHSLRLDQATRIEVVGRGEYRLEKGRVYVDSHGAKGRGAVRIETPVASVTEVGTQFQVQWSTPQMQLRVRVREGSVMLAEESSPGLPHSVIAGEAAVLAPGQELARMADSSFGPDWAWVAAISPGLDPQEHRLAQILAWVCREMGCRLRYADARTQHLVAQVELGGSLQGLTPEQTLEVLKRITNFRYRSAAGELIVDAVDETV
jgi:ferric-dicitrate binding protein FerR (iron transport regulator)